MYFLIIDVPVPILTWWGRNWYLPLVTWSKFHRSVMFSFENNFHAAVKLQSIGVLMYAVCYLCPAPNPASHLIFIHKFRISELFCYEHYVYHDTDACCQPGRNMFYHSSAPFLSPAMWLPRRCCQPGQCCGSEIIFFSDPAPTFQGISDPAPDPISVPAKFLSKEAKSNFFYKTAAQILVFRFW